METEGAPTAANWRIRRGLRSEPSLEKGGLWPGRGCGVGGGIAPVLVSYLCMVEEVGAANWGGSARAAPGAAQ